MAIFGKQPPRRNLDTKEVIATAHFIRDECVDLSGSELSMFEALTIATSWHISDLNQQDRDVQDENMFGFADEIASAIKGEEPFRLRN